jgi:hypothetical protein
MTTPRHALALAAGLLLACASSDPGSPLPALPGDAVPLEELRASPPPPLSLTWNTGFEDPSRLVIRTPEAWGEAWARIWERGSYKPALPTADFDTEMVVLVAMGSRPSGGYDILLTSAAVQDGVLRIGVAELSPGRGCAAIDAITTPVAAARLTRFDGPIEFVETSRAHDCE